MEPCLICGGPTMSWLTAWRLNSKDWVKRCHAVAALERDGPAAVDRLLAILRNDPEPAVRRQAAWSLGRIKDLRAVDPLIVALGDHGAAEGAASALGQIGDGRSCEALISLVRAGGHEDIRRIARDAVAKIGHTLPASRLV